MNKSIIAFAAAASLLGAVTTANAAFSAGNQVEVSYLYPDISTVYAPPPVVLTGPDDSILNFVGFLNIVFTDTSVTLTATRPAGINSVAFDGVRIVDQNNTLSFAGYVLDTVNTNYAGFNSSRVTYGPSTLYLNVVGLAGQTGQKIVLSATPVPEPAGVAMALVALLGLGAVARRRNQN